MTGSCILAALLLAPPPPDVAPHEAGDPPAEAAPLPAPPPETIAVDLLAGVWLPRLGGTSSLNGSGALDLAEDYQLDSMENVLNAELTIRKGEFFDLLFSGFGSSTDALTSFATAGSFGPVAIAPGDTVRSSADITSLNAELGLNLWRPYTRTPQVVDEYDNRTADGRYVADLRLTPLLGIRFIDASQAVTNVTASTTATGEGEWLAAYAGFQVTCDWRPEPSWLRLVRFQGGFGLGPALGGDGGFMWQVRAGLTVHPTENFGLTLGYRLLELSVENDGWELDGGLQGLFVAGSIRF
jgi:hypothetical protein